MERKTHIWIGNSTIVDNGKKSEGRFVGIDTEKYYQISNYHEMPDFFISIVSDSDHWMFISSNGSLTAGRKNRDNALFPYYTDDKIHDHRDITGSKTYFLVEKERKIFLWEPFTQESRKLYHITRNLSKSIYGNKIIFEEINHDLGLSYRYGWYNSEKFGFVKKSRLNYTGPNKMCVEILDGIQNILPFGVDYAFQNEFSNLLDAYKKNERIKGSSLGIFTLSSIPVDRAEPSESLKATAVWSVGFNGNYKILVSDKQIDRFKKGLAIESEYDVRAARGAYFMNASVELGENEPEEWMTIADINQDSADVVNLDHFIKTIVDAGKFVNDDIEKGTENLKKLVSGADGIQFTNSELSCTRHYMNTLFNIMRGGTFAHGYLVEMSDFRQYLAKINKTISNKFQFWVEKLPPKISSFDLIDMAKEAEDPDLIRIAYEYLPLVFSRRHGDPSRPWNIFSIETKNEDGSIKYNYEGNWRDIFQNWEALSWSFPGFIEGIIFKFVNASTIDGYNPYRIMRSGIDWECPDPNDPWSYIGYWGDHQIIYLQKLLELSNDFRPGILDDLLTREIFTYANVPYRLKPYREIVKNPKDTVVFDDVLNKRIKAEWTILGSDASLLKDYSGIQIYKVNLAEKILVTLLSKLSNFIPEAGIWMNTQRPEWNDANNALVGNGTSMVTLYYLRRFLQFWNQKFTNVFIKDIGVSIEVATLFQKIHNYLNENISLIKKEISPVDRKKFADFMGNAHDEYRSRIYTHSFTGEKSQLRIQELIDFTRLCIQFIDHSIKANRREDGLYHAYNLISLNEDSITIRHLYEMLEGQVALLSSGYLSPEESLEVLDKLKRSDMFRPDQYSYMLYPDRILPRFMEKNIIPLEAVRQSVLLQKLVENKETSIIKVDNEDNYHFNGSFRNADMLEAALDKLDNRNYKNLLKKEKGKILTIFEDIFDHQSFTGRSGTFYGYEGLGSIYWHMVSKLLLATQECYLTAVEKRTAADILSRLKDHYFEIRAGIGFNKEPALYGAFPTDAYSHTPGNAGVKQPGLTGQVKEDVISRMQELGINVRHGKIIFNTSLLHHKEWLDQPAKFGFYDLEGKYRKIKLEPNQLGYTFCQVPVIYTRSDKDAIIVKYKNGDYTNFQGNGLDADTSAQLFERNGSLSRIDVFLKDITSGR